MVSATHFFAFIAASFVIIVIPGPSVMFAVGRALALGRRAALLTVVGNTVGVIIPVLAVAFGLGAILAASAIALTVVKLIGAVYLVYLGIQAIRERKALAAALGTRVPPTETRRVLWQGFLVGLTNPKALVFLAAVLPQFTDPVDGPIQLQLLTLGATFLVMALLLDGTWALLAGTARNWFAKSPRRLEAVGGTGGLLIIGVGAGMAVSGSSS